MKSRAIRAAGVAIATLISVGGIVAATAGVAGAATHTVHLVGTTGTVSSTTRFVFSTTAGAKSNTDGCGASTTAKFVTGATPTHNTTAMTDTNCATGAGTATLTGLGAATSKLHATATGLVRTGNALKLATGKVSFSVSFGAGATTNCTVEFTKAVTLTGPRTAFTVSGVKTGTTGGSRNTTVTPHAGGKCKTLTTLLGKGTSQFSATLTFNVRP
jgi:hypothetical protein